MPYPTRPPRFYALLTGEARHRDDDAPPRAVQPSPCPPPVPERPSLRPRPALPAASGGIEAAREEYRYFKAAGMLAVWRERWKAILRPP